MPVLANRYSLSDRTADVLHGARVPFTSALWIDCIVRTMVYRLSSREGSPVEALSRISSNVARFAQREGKYGIADGDPMTIEAGHIRVNEEERWVLRLY